MTQVTPTQFICYRPKVTLIVRKEDGFVIGGDSFTFVKAIGELDANGVAYEDQEEERKKYLLNLNKEVETVIPTKILSKVLGLIDSVEGKC